MSYKII